MSLLKVEQKVPGKAIGQMLFQLFFDGKVTIGGHEVYIDNPQLPVATKMKDFVQWEFKSPLKVSTPGPDSSINVVRQYKDRIEFELWPWANVKLVLT
jgi:hypothetical protein